MNKIFLWVAAAFVLLQSCEKNDGIRDEIDNLRDRVTALESKVGDVNRNIVALHKLLNESTLIVGVNKTPTGYEIELSDGSKLPIVLGDKIDALVPIMGIDAQGYWTVSLDNGATSTRVMVNGNFVSAWPEHNGDPENEAEGATPKLKIDADGYWLISLDGVNYTPLLQDGQKVSAVGSGSSSSSSPFQSVTYDKTTATLTVVLLNGTKLVLPVEDTFSLIITAAAEETFYLSDLRVFEVAQKGVAEARITAPAGWKVVLDETTLTVTAPATYSAAGALASIDVVIVSDKKYIKSTTLRAKLLNEVRDANACKAWQDFKAGTAENVLLDFSYAGYKHGEEAPADVWGLGYTVYDMTKYGADPTGKTSSRAALLALLKQLKLTGQSDGGSNLSNASAKAVIYFPAGRYILHDDDDNLVDASSQNQIYKDPKGNNKSETISVRGGNYVIKGDGRDKTTLVMATPNLPNRSDDMWSSPVMISLQHYSGLSDKTTVTADSPKGGFSVQVGSTAGISSGDWVCLSLSNSDPTLVAQELAPHKVDFAHMTNIQTITIADYHQVKSVSGNTVTFYEPLMHAVEAKWDWKIRTYPHYENVGVEDLAFEGNSKPDFLHHASWADDGAYKPLVMSRLTNSWIRRVDFRNISEAVSIISSANCSAYQVEISGNRGHSGIRSQASSRVFIGKVNERSNGKTSDPKPAQPNVFMENAGQFHASGVSQTSMGAVLWNNTWGGDSFFESHSSQPRATLVDRCTGGFVQWRFGGDETAVPNHLSDLTIWNMNATRALHDFGGGTFKWWLSENWWWKVMPPIIVGFHGEAVNFDADPSQTKYLESNGAIVGPESLYEAQLRLRLGYVPAWLNSLK